MVPPALASERELASAPGPVALERERERAWVPPALAEERELASALGPVASERERERAWVPPVLAEVRELAPAPGQVVSEQAWGWEWVPLVLKNRVWAGVLDQAATLEYRAPRLQCRRQACSPWQLASPVFRWPERELVPVRDQPPA